MGKGVFWRPLAAGLLMLASAPSQALMLDYGGFYDRMKVVNKADYPLVSIAFYLNHRARMVPCEITHAALRFKGEILPLGVNTHNELLLPFKAEFKTDKAVLDLTVEEGAQCDFAMQLRYADPLQSTFSPVELAALIQQFDQVLKGFAGFPFRLLQPDVTGVVIQLAPDSLATGESGQALMAAVDERGRITLTLDQLDALGSMAFSAPPRWIGPYIVR
ncbi:DUF2987 domain-containing protein [Ferrimonas gelatinilytica]|uniref:DUF2987 domain-containing protein n=1 Tax=Ferrimonas gelatinilytica TaxID=1255257 RepID=A0ABP9RXM3_9GAMM